MMRDKIIVKQLVCAGCKRLLGYVPWPRSEGRPRMHLVDEAEFQCPKCPESQVLVRPRWMEFATRKDVMA